jgi:hypothetical protein
MYASFDTTGGIHLMDPWLYVFSSLLHSIVPSLFFHSPNFRSFEFSAIRTCVNQRHATYGRTRDSGGDVPTSHVYSCREANVGFFSGASRVVFQIHPWSIRGPCLGFDYSTSDFLALWKELFFVDVSFIACLPDLHRTFFASYLNAILSYHHSNLLHPTAIPWAATLARTTLPHSKPYKILSLSTVRPLSPPSVHSSNHLVQMRANASHSVFTLILSTLLYDYPLSFRPLALTHSLSLVSPTRPPPILQSG